MIQEETAADACPPDASDVSSAGAGGEWHASGGQASDMPLLVGSTRRKPGVEQLDRYGLKELLRLLAEDRSPKLKVRCRRWGTCLCMGGAPQWGLRCFSWPFKYWQADATPEPCRC